MGFFKTNKVPVVTEEVEQEDKVTMTIQRPADAEFAYQVGITYKENRIVDIAEHIVALYSKKLLVGEDSFSYRTNNSFGNPGISIPYELIDSVVSEIEKIIGDNFEVLYDDDKIYSHYRYLNIKRKHVEEKINASI